MSNVHKHIFLKAFMVLSLHRDLYDIINILGRKNVLFEKKMFTEILPINANEKIFLLNFLIDSNEISFKPFQRNYLIANRNLR